MRTVGATSHGFFRSIPPSHRSFSPCGFPCMHGARARRAVLARFGMTGGVQAQYSTIN